MPVFQLLHRPPQWLRALLAAMLLAFAANSIAHAAHQHDASLAAAAHSLGCNYCAAFGSLADAPRHTYAAPAPTHPPIALASPAIAVRSTELASSARPRAPPLS